MKLKKAVLVFATIGALCSQGSLLKNGDFEIGTLPGADGWTMCPHYRVEESAGRNGSRGLIVENSDPNAMSGEFCGQFVEAKPGFKYKFSGWVKCENVTGHAKDTGIKARVLVLVFVFDAKGKGLGEYYTEFKAGTVSDWTRIEGETPPLPATAARLQVNPFVWHNATGRAWFDDISIEQVESIPVRGLYSSAYRDIAWEGFVKFSAVLGIDTVAMPLDKLVAEFVYSTGNYTCKRVSAETFTATLAQATIPVANLPMGKYPVSFELRRKDGRKLISEIPLMFTRTAVPPKRKIWIDSRNRLIVGGRPFFPLGFYGTMINEKYISKMDGTPFNCYMPYRYLGTNEFNIAARHGLWIIANMKDFIPGKGGTPCCKVLETNGEADRGLICRFHALKDYPKLLCWYMNDESSVEQIERLTRQYRYVRENDPDHPVWAVLFQHDQVREYMGTCDVIGNDDYPIGLRPIETVSRYARETVDGFLGGPCWHVPQAINWKHYLKTGNTENFRMPTLEEARSMSWQYIANGGNGLIYYTFERLIDEGGRFWENYCTVAREVKSLESILLADPAPNATGYPPLMGGRAWTQDGRMYLLLVNENETPRSANLKLASRFASVKAMNALPSKARISLDGDKLHVEMEPIGVVMLELDPDDQQKGQMKLACQMWGVKEFWEKDPEKGFAEVFPRVKAMGYEGVQSMAFWNINQDRLEALLKANGLALADMPINFDHVEGTNVERTVAFCRRFDVDFVYIPWFGGKTAAEWRAFCNRLAAAGKRLAPYDIRIGYHNHIHEFTKPLDGEYPAEILKADRNVNLELDIGPVTESGNDAVKWITDLSGRIPGMHAKPHGASAAGAPGDVQDWPKIVAAARKAGVKWFVVECEKRKDTYNDVATSAAYLKPLLGNRQCADKSCSRSPR